MHPTTKRLNFILLKKAGLICEWKGPRIPIDPRYKEIMELEMNRLIQNSRNLYDREDTFLQYLKHK